MYAALSHRALNRADLCDSRACRVAVCATRRLPLFGTPTLTACVRPTISHVVSLRGVCRRRADTDWELLCLNQKKEQGLNRDSNKLLLPKPLGPDGFGWYNLSDYAIRRRQRQLAKEYGVYGFAIYHCARLCVMRGGRSLARACSRRVR